MMYANQEIGLMPIPADEHDNFLGTLIGTGTSFLKTGNCAIWDEKCQKNEALATQARLEEAKAAQAIAANNQQKDQSQMMMLAGGGALVVLVFVMLMLKK